MRPHAPAPIIRIVSQVPSFQPVVPSAAYRPVLPLRPPLLGAMGVSAIVVAVLSILASLLTIGYAAGLYLSSNAARDRVLRNAPLAMPVSSPGQPVRLRATPALQIGRHGLNSYQRSAVVSAMEPLISMTPQQAGQLDALLAEDGDEMFGARDNETVLADEVRRQVADRVGRFAASDASAFYFETSIGRAEIYSDRALFYRRNSPAIVRAAAGRRLNVSGHPILTSGDVEALAALAAESADHQFTLLQLVTLRQLLADPQQKLVALNQSPEGWSVGLDDASVRRDGYAVINFAGGPLLLDPRGNVILRTSMDAVPVVSTAACGATVADGIFSIGLAVLLLVTGVRLVRSPHVRLRSVHIYAVLKTAAAAAGGAAAGWMTASYLALPALTPAPQGSFPGPAAWGAIVGAGFALIGLAYPVAIEIAARSQTLRQHYALFE